MVAAGDFRNGMTVEIDGTVYQIIEFQHVKPGKGAAFVRTKLRDVMGGSVVEKTFRPTEKFPPARIERKEMQYLYTDGDLYYFMDMETYEQIEIGQETIGDALEFVKEESYVYKKGEDGTYTMTKVQTGLSDGVNIEIKEGLSEGDTVRGPRIIEDETTQETTETTETAEQEESTDNAE